MATTTNLALEGSDSADEPAFEGAVIAAVSGLLLIESPTRYFVALGDVAPCSEVNHRAA